MKTLIGIVVLLTMVVGCSSTVKLGLGTLTLDTTLTVEEWAQNPLIDNLSSLLQRAKEESEGTEEPADEGETVPE